MISEITANNCFKFCLRGSICAIADFLVLEVFNSNQLSVYSYFIRKASENSFVRSSKRLMHGSILPVTIPPRGIPPGIYNFFSHLAVYSPPPGTQKETIPHPRGSSSTTNTLFCSKTRRFGENFNYFLEFIERRTLYNKNMHTIFENEN